MWGSCNHSWALLESHRFEEALSDVIKTGNIKITEYLAEKLSSRGVISVVRCENCGEIKHLKEKIH